VDVAYEFGIDEPDIYRIRFICFYEITQFYFIMW